MSEQTITTIRPRDATLLATTAEAPEKAPVAMRPMASITRAEMSPLILTLAAQRAADRSNDADEKKLALPIPRDPHQEVTLERVMERAYDQQAALNALARSISAHDLGDAAAQLAQALDAFYDLTVNHHEMWRENLLRREVTYCLASALSVVAKEAGIEVRELAGEWGERIVGEASDDLGDV